jgi:hypothetical protein
MPCSSSMHTNTHIESVAVIPYIELCNNASMSLLRPVSLLWAGQRTERIADSQLVLDCESIVHILGIHDHRARR